MAEGPDHAGRCALDFDEKEEVLICALCPSHVFNLKKAVSRSAVLQSLLAVGQLRPGGFAEKEAKQGEGGG